MYEGIGDPGLVKDCRFDPEILTTLEFSGFGRLLALTNFLLLISTSCPFPDTTLSVEIAEVNLFTFVGI